MYTYAFTRIVFNSYNMKRMKKKMTERAGPMHLKPPPPLLMAPPREQAAVRIFGASSGDSNGVCKATMWMCCSFMAMGAASRPTTQMNRCVHTGTHIIWKSDTTNQAGGPECDLAASCRASLRCRISRLWSTQSFVVYRLLPLGVEGCGGKRGRTSTGGVGGKVWR